MSLRQRHHKGLSLPRRQRKSVGNPHWLYSGPHKTKRTHFESKSPKQIYTITQKQRQHWEIAVKFIEPNLQNEVYVWLRIELKGGWRHESGVGRYRIGSSIQLRQRSLGGRAGVIDRRGHQGRQSDDLRHQQRSTQTDQPTNNKKTLQFRRHDSVKKGRSHYPIWKSMPKFIHNKQVRAKQWGKRGRTETVLGNGANQQRKCCGHWVASRTWKDVHLGRK